MGRDDDLEIKSYTLYVSIRAPAWDATAASAIGLANGKTFLSARPHGTRQPVAVAAERLRKFLSARPHGTRR